MRILFTLCAILTSCILLPAQNQLQLTFNLDSVGRQVNFDAMGVNVERMFYRMIDSNAKIPAEIFDDLLNAGDLIYRWPGGATANFYHYKGGLSKGYGLSRYEVESISHPMKCNATNDGSDNCMTFDMAAPRNYLYELLDYADAYYNRTGKKKKIVWLPNIFTFFIHNKEEITKLNAANSLEDAKKMVEDSIISLDFYERLKDNVDVYNILANHPTIDLLGIEYGNELYFHEVVTNIKYDATNSLSALIFAALKSRLDAEVRKGIHQVTTLVKFYNKEIVAKNPTLKTAIPVAIINYLGKHANANLLWNTAVNDSLINHVDGVIHHFYFKIPDGPRIDPRTAENPDMSDTLVKIKELADQFIHDRLPRVDGHYDQFFKLTSTNKKMWITEFNTDNGYFDGYLCEWQNTFFHSYFQYEAFISFIDNYHDNDMVKFAFPHLWVSYLNDANYGAYAVQVEPNGTYKKIRRTAFNTYEVLGSLINRDLRKIKFEYTNTKNYDRKDLFVKAYFEPGNGIEEDEIGKIYIAYTNKSGEAIKINPQNDFIIQGTQVDSLKLMKGFSRRLSAPHIYSSNGYTFHDSTDETTENVTVEDILEIDPIEDHEIPGYSVGYVAFPIYKKESGVPTANKELKKQRLSIYPNPAQSSINIVADNKQIVDWQRGNFFITDITGKLIRVKVQERSGSTLKLDISGLPAGVYQFVYYLDNFQYTTPFVVQ